ncbi:hypothetical protein GGR55DRAFT_650718 [Xylaria sp. FL0064]|nr:hypothetical protein GGR55DRAFT_650718 [Xylaria sp. FL0064]
MSRPVPTDKSSWEYAYQAINTQWISIHEYQLSASGSKIAEEQFLLLCTFWKGKDAYRFSQEVDQWVNRKYLLQAQHFLNSDPLVKNIWQEFLNATSLKADDLYDRAYAGLGTFSLARYHQLQSQGLTDDGGTGAPKVDFSPPVSSRTRAQLSRRVPDPSTPTRAPVSTSASISGLEGLSLDGLQLSDTPSTPPPPAIPEDHSSPFVDPVMLKDIQDEQIVNTALIDYLNALSIHCKALKSHWTLHRLALVARNNSKEKSYEARVDGYLKSPRDGQPLVIAEVKPCRRWKNLRQIRMQESAQMAAWINEHPPRTQGQSRRLLISQDRDEIFLTFGQFDKNYVDYICHKTKDVRVTSPLVMYEFGPFDVGEKTDMRVVREIVLAYALEACQTLR